MAHANGAIEWSLGRNTSLAATYIFAAGSSLARSIDRNLGSMTERTLTVAGTGETARYHFFGADRPFQNFQRVIAFESNAESRYHGLTLDLNRRFAGNSMFRVAYTLGRVIDTVPDATAVALGSVQDDQKYASNPADFEVDRTFGNNDQRHRLVASGVYGVGGWWFSGIFTAQSGQPVLGARQRRPQRRRQRPQRFGAWYAAKRLPPAGHHPARLRVSRATSLSADGFGRSSSPRPSISSTATTSTVSSICDTA